jgi:hypothetical protein
MLVNSEPYELLILGCSCNPSVVGSCQGPEVLPLTASSLLLQRLHHHSSYSIATLRLRCCYATYHFLLYHYVSFLPLS